MAYFYLTQNINRREPDTLASKSYIHIKARADGMQTAIAADELIELDGVEPKTIEELQTILDVWIEAENESAVPDSEDVIHMQRRIDLNLYIASRQLKEQADFLRIERGQVRPGDTNLSFSELLKRASPVEVELFWTRVNRILRPNSSG